MENMQLSLLLNTENPRSVFDEVRTIVRLMFPAFDFETLELIFTDILRLFDGAYPGYRECTTHYHDLKHTTDTFLAMARLMHGAWEGAAPLAGKHITLGLVCALMHDTGFIQAMGDAVGTGAKYTPIHVVRSITFMGNYLDENRLSRDEFTGYPDIIRCTGLATEVSKIKFESIQTELLGKMLGTADLLGQMADRAYLEKLLSLYREFREAGIKGYESELDLLRKTPGFWDLTKERFVAELSSVNEYMRSHFKAHWNIDRDLYLDAIEKNIGYLRFILEHHEENYRDYLCRDRKTENLNEKKPMSSRRE
jgi:hypothetical protein